MALSQQAVISKLRTRVAEVTGLARCYAASESDDNALPMALNELPAAIVAPGPTLAYELKGGQHDHTYEAHVQVFQGGADLGGRAATVMPFVDLLIEKFAVNVGLGTLVTYALFRRSSGLVGLNFAGIDYTGFELVFEIRETAASTPARGS